MTKRKKGLLFACACACVLAAGAGLGFAPVNHFAYADGSTAEASYWKEVPHISGWSWGSFNAGEKPFSAIPTDDFTNNVEFTFKNAKGQTLLTIYEQIENGVHVRYRYDNLGIIEPEDLPVYLNSTLGRWDAGDYTMEAYADSQSEYKHNSIVNFSILKGKNYWVQTPYIESWYEREWTEVKDFPAPVAQSAYGDLVEYKIYGATDEGEINYKSIYYEGTSNPDAIPDVTDIRGAEEGHYFLAAHVAGTDNYEELNAIVPFRIYDSKATAAAVAAAREDAYVEINRFAEECKVNVSDNAVRDTLHNIEIATTVTGVQRGLTATKLIIFKIYAKNTISKYAVDMGTDITLNDSVLSAVVRDINDAPDISTVEEKITVAFGIIYEEAVKLERGKALKELTDYADGIIEVTETFTDAKTIEEVHELLAKKKHEVDERVLIEGNIAELEAYKLRVAAAIENYAQYIGIEFDLSQSDTQTNFKLIDIRLAETFDEVDELYREAKQFILGKLNDEKYLLIARLKEFANSYLTEDKYPLAREAVSQILDLGQTLNQRICKDMLDGEKIPTVVRANELYEDSRKEIEEIILPRAQEKVTAELNKLAADAKIPEFDAQLQEFLDAVKEAKTLDEVEEILAAASFQINNTLYTARMEKIRDLDDFAAEYFTVHNWSMISWNMLFGALEDGKNGIYGAKSVEEIYAAGENAKVLFMRAYVNAELDYYSEIYADYDIERIVETQKELSKTSATVKGLQTILGDADEQIYRAAKTNAPESLKTLSSFFANFDYSNDVKKIENAEDLKTLHAAYTAAVERLNILKAEVQTARSMLEMYAESYGLSASSNPVLLAIDKIYGAASPEDLPELVKEAKADIDAAAAKAQKRIDSVNAGLIACTVVFAVMAVGFATLLVILWRKKKSPAKKSVETETEKKEPDEEDQQKPIE